MKTLWRYIASWWHTPRNDSKCTTTQLIPTSINSLEDVRLFIRDSYEKPKFWMSFLENLGECWKFLLNSLPIHPIFLGIYCYIAITIVVINTDRSIWWFFSPMLVSFFPITIAFITTCNSRMKWHYKLHHYDDTTLFTHLSEAISLRIRRARESLIVGPLSSIGLRQKELYAMRDEINQKIGYFTGRKADGMKDADDMLDLLRMHHAELMVHEVSLVKKQELLAKAFGVCEARVPFILQVANDMRQRKEVYALSERLGIFREGLPQLELEMAQAINREFNGISSILTSAVEQSLAIAPPLLTGHEIQMVMQECIAGEQKMQSALQTAAEPYGLELA